MVYKVAVAQYPAHQTRGGGCKTNNCFWRHNQNGNRAHNSVIVQSEQQNQRPTTETVFGWGRQNALQKHRGEPHFSFRVLFTEPKALRPIRRKKYHIISVFLDWFSNIHSADQKHPSLGPGALFLLDHDTNNRMTQYYFKIGKH